MGAELSSAPAPDAREDVTVFCPTPLLTVTIEAASDGGPELHVHAGGQGFWVARMAARLGGRTVLCAPFGGDAGRLLPILIAEERVQVKGVAVAGTNGSYVHDRRSGERQEICKIAGTSLTRHEYDDLYNATFTAAMDSRLLVLTGQYPGPVVPADVYRRLVHDAQSNRRRVIADLSGSDLDAVMQVGIEWLCFSHEEMICHGLASSDTPGDLIAGMKSLHQRGARHIILHRGPEPTLVLIDEEILEVIAPEVQPLDTRGGGDTFFAALAVGLARQRPIEETIRFCAAAGTLNVTRHGLGTGSLEDIEALSRHVQVRPLSEGIL